MVFIMQVRTCRNCPYAPADLGPHFSAQAQELCCLDCQIAKPASDRVYPRRRPKAPAFMPTPQELPAAAEPVRERAIAR